MRFFGKKQETNKEKTEVVNSKLQTVNINDKYNQKIVITKDSWLDEYLYPSILTNYDNFYELANLVIEAFNNGIYEEVKDICIDLYNFYDEKEISYNLLAICYVNLEKSNEAKELYKEYMKKYEASDIIFYNFALLLEKESRITEAQKYFKKALEVNPNMTKPLSKLIEYSNSVDVKKDFDEYFMKKLVNSKNSWRAKLILANDELKNKHPRKAKEYLKMVLVESNYNPEAMTAVAALYGKNSMIQEFEENILPIYNPEFHGSYLALNVLNHLLVVGDYDSGLELLNLISKYDWNEFSDEFIKLEEKFFNLKLDNENEEIDENEINLFSSDTPLWYEAFKEPVWLLNSLEKIRPSLLILPFTIIGETNKDLTRKLASSIPVFLSEEISMKSNLEHQLIITYNYKDVIFPKNKYDTEYMNDIVEKNKHLDYIVSGNILAVGDYLELDLYLYDCFSGQKIPLLTEKLNKDNIKNIFIKIIIKFSNFFSEFKDTTKIDDLKNEFFLDYSNKLLFKLNLNNQNYYSSWLIKNTFINQIEAIISDDSNFENKIELTVMLNFIKKYQPQLLSTFKNTIYELLSDGFYDSYEARKLIPIFFYIYNDNSNFNTFLKELNTNDEDYFHWINDFIS